jgi:tungstate transport system ATP-binding protein
MGPGENRGAPVGLTLELVKIAKLYNGNPVLKNCSHTFAAGGSYILMGPNGSGKSTLFRIAALLERSDGGEVKYLSGTELKPPNIHLRRRITMVFPRVGVFNSTVFANVAYGLKIRGVKRTVVKERVAEILAKVGLTHKAHQQAVTLSSGETMRLGLARALVIQPEVLFLDEPTAHIDKANTKIIEDCILRIRKEGALTLFIITHDPVQADRLGGQKLLLREGKIIEC